MTVSWHKGCVAADSEEGGRVRGIGGDNDSEVGEGLFTTRKLRKLWMNPICFRGVGSVSNEPFAYK